MATKKKTTPKRPTPTEAALGRNVPIRFTKEYQRPMNMGGRVFRKGEEYFVTKEDAEKWVELGVVEIVTTDKAS